MANQRLPGFNFSIRDGGLIPITNLPNTDTLLIIGAALDGPVNTPISITNLGDAENLFGPLTYSGDYLNPVTSTADGAYADNSLIKALNEAMLGGAGSVLLVRCGGTAASGTITSVNTPLKVYGKYPGRIYNGSVITVSASAAAIGVTITQTTTKGGNLSYSFPIATKVITALSTINSDVYNQSVYMDIATSAYQSAVTAIATGTVTIAGGTNGTRAQGCDNYSTMNMYYNMLTGTNGTFDTIVDAEFDIALLAGIYADDQVIDTAAATTTSVAQDFANWCYKVSSESQPVHGVIGVRPSGIRTITDSTALANNNYLQSTAGYYDQSGRQICMGYFLKNGFYYTDTTAQETVDVGRHLSVVVGPDLILTQKDIGYYLENGAAAYAGMVCKLPAQSATTNKAIGAIKLLNYTFSKDILEKLNQGVGRDLTIAKFAGGGAYVTFKKRSTDGRPIVVADNTCSMRGSDYQTLQVLRIANTASHLVKIVMTPFLGEPNNVEARTAMKTNLTTALDKMVDAGALLGGNGNGYQFTISSDPVETILGQITITLFLRPALQIKFVKVVVNVSQ